jgi:peptidoglycan/LPS O-acetylase OafA/YrhL
VIGTWGVLIGLNLEQTRKLMSGASPTILTAVGCFCFTIWAVFVWMSPDKFFYNSVHPYISFVPVLGLWILRNSHPILQVQSLKVLKFIGQRSLEFYLLQFHILMGANAKGLLVLIPSFPALNFMLCVALFVLCAVTVFDCTKVIQEKASLSFVLVAMVLFCGLLATVMPDHWLLLCELLCCACVVFGMSCRK